MKWNKNILFPFAVYLFLIVITDPYRYLDYENPQAYSFSTEYKKLDIKVYCAEGHNDCNNKEQAARTESTSHDTPREVERYFCYICNPPQWIYL